MDASRHFVSLFHFLKKSKIIYSFFCSDVESGNNEVSVFVYDRGNKLPNGEDRFLGMSSIKPKLINDKFVELIFPLHGRPEDDQEVTGDVRLQVTYKSTKKVRPTKKNIKL